MIQFQMVASIHLNSLKCEQDRVYVKHLVSIP